MDMVVIVMTMNLFSNGGSERVGFIHVGMDLEDIDLEKGAWF